MVALARKTLVYEWRRFLPAMVAIAFASLLLLLQASLVLGIFGSSSVYVSGSDADLWLGYPGTQSVDQGRAINPDNACYTCNRRSRAWSRSFGSTATGAVRSIPVACRCSSPGSMHVLMD